MEAIRNYVEALFAALPQREDVLRVKADMLANLEDKFNTLLDEGKTRPRRPGWSLRRSVPHRNCAANSIWIPSLRKFRLNLHPRLSILRWQRSTASIRSGSMC